jgi:DNA-binding NtrC family response regulator
MEGNNSKLDNLAWSLAEAVEGEAYDEVLAAVQIALIEFSIKRNGGGTNAAKALKINRTRLYGIMTKYGLPNFTQRYRGWKTKQCQ